uniref:CSON013108 protein n=1 Tax=Culicoides sonorensis TaxID=179676 RepID=A0A336M713_CULSO
MKYNLSLCQVSYLSVLSTHTRDSCKRIMKIKNCNEINKKTEHFNVLKGEKQTNYSELLSCSYKMARASSNPYNKSYLTVLHRLNENILTFYDETYENDKKENNQDFIVLQLK